MTIKLLRQREVQAMTTIPRSTLYAKVANGTFPKPVKLGERAAAWRESDVIAWMESLTDDPAEPLKT